MNALIITGGEINLEFAKNFLDKREYNLIISVDGGLRIADNLSIKSDIIIGDFDTISAEILKKYMGKTEIVKLNPIKDSTDTEEAVSIAIERGISDIDMIGGTGSRIDHTLANMFLLKKALLTNVRLTIYGCNFEMYAINSYAKIKNMHKYKYISFIPFDGPAKGVTLKGFKYLVEDFDFDTQKTFRLGISNEFADEYGEVYINSGFLLVILSND